MVFVNQMLILFFSLFSLSLFFYPSQFPLFLCFLINPPRKVGSACSLEKMDKLMAELQEKDILPDDYLIKLYLRRKEELTSQAPPPDTKAGTP